jgi:3-deoxy-D-manno-octulosonic-acid transferase
MHGASVGEMVALQPIARRFHAVRPDAHVVVSTITPTGQDVARRAFDWAEQVRYFPLDTPGPVARSVNAVGANVVVLLETELWPNFLHAASLMGPVLLANGRISDRTVRRARRVRPLYRWMLGHLSMMGMQTEGDAERIIALGAPPDRVRVLGTSKFDEAVPALDDAGRAEWRSKLRLGQDRVLIAGSTFPGEDEAVLSAYQICRAVAPGLRLLIAPRHIDRAEDVALLARKSGLSVGLRSGELTGDENVVVINSYGELAGLYGLAEAAFIGRSLGENRGGQNLIQPMAHGVPVVHGPNMQNFRDVAEQADKAAASELVLDAEGLADAWLRMITTPELRGAMGVAGRRLVESNKGASDRYAQMISSALGRRN